MNNDKEYFWIFISLGLGDALVCNGLIRHYAALHSDKYIIIPVWEHNLAAVQWSLEDVKNIFFYPIETEQQLLDCRNHISSGQRLCLGFYECNYDVFTRMLKENPTLQMQGSAIDGLLSDFNPVKWDSEFYRQAGLDPELSYSGFRVPDFKLNLPLMPKYPMRVYHHDLERGFAIKDAPFDILFNDYKGTLENPGGIFLSNKIPLRDSCHFIHNAGELHLIDSSMLCLADRLPTPHCKRFVFHRYARRGLPPTLRKPWEVID